MRMTKKLYEEMSEFYYKRNENLGIWATDDIYKKHSKIRGEKMNRREAFRLITEQAGKIVTKMTMKRLKSRGA